jgi:hypothetical protein
VVVEAMVAGDVKAAMFWLERRRAAEWRMQTQQQIDGMVALEHDYPAEVLAIASRYARLTPAEVEQEIKGLAWVTEPPTVPSPAPAEADSIMGGASALIGEGSANRGPAQQPATPDSTPQVGSDRSNGTTMPSQALAPLQPPERVEPMKCAHCRGTVPGNHQSGCPAFHEDGRVRLTAMAFGDPR